MIREIVLPALGETMDEAVILRWLKEEGDPVAKGEPIFEIETDKATIEVEALEGGLLRAMTVPAGERVSIGAVVGYLADAMDEPLPDGGHKAARPSTATVKTEAAGVEPPLAPAKPATSRKVIASPRARRLADREGVDLALIPEGTGPKGRIVEADVKRFLEVRGAPARAPSSEAPTPPPVGGVGDRIVPLEGARKVIAERMTRSAQTAPHFTLTISVDMTTAESARQMLGERARERGVSISTTAFLTFTCAWALRRNPWVNATLRDEQICLLGEVHIGVAVARESGLIVPVIRNADRKGMEQIAQELEDLTQRARSGSLRSEQMGGSTFTLSNLGMYGVDHFTAIINPPESAILAVGRIARAVVPQEDDTLAVRPIMRMTLSCDHRVIDGSVGARFLQDLREALERPAIMLG